MTRDVELSVLLDRIDHKGYPAYKDTKGKYQFQGYVFSIDHVQGDPFAAPSKVSVHIPGKTAGFAADLYSEPWRRIALQDFLLRKFAGKIHEFSFQAHGSGKSGLISVTRPGQEILERSACVIDPNEGGVTVRLEIGFPANGRTINSRELKKIIFDFLPICVKKTLYAAAYRKEELQAVADLADDQQAIRAQIKEKGLVAFVANGAVLPRTSGISQLPMKGAVTFTSPESMEVEMGLPHKGCLKGMGIPCGVTLIVGGGYHGKSTLLAALERGVYNHIAGDGREYVITDASAMKLRAEDGRSIQKVDISMFIRNLPNKKDTVAFSTEDASGSTSQAANTIEAMEAGAKAFLIDEDTSATNFMIRDDLMQQVINRDEEPIIPFIDRVVQLYKEAGVSTVLVAGSCGAYFHVADKVIQMKNYRPYDITERTKKVAEEYPLAVREGAELPECDWENVLKGGKRVVRRDTSFGNAHAFDETEEEEQGQNEIEGSRTDDASGRDGRQMETRRQDGRYGHGRGYGHDGARDGRENRVKMKTMGTDTISINKESIDLRLVEQLIDPEQLAAAAMIVKYLKQQVFDGKKTIYEAVEELEKAVEKKGFAAFCSGDIPGNLVIPRRQEIFAVINRCRGLIRVE